MEEPAETKAAKQLDRWLAALNHPLRRRIIALVGGGGGPSQGWTPSEIAETLELPLTNVSYHVRCLSEWGALELRDEERVRGATKHFYVLNQRFRTRNWVLALMKEGIEG